MKKHALLIGINTYSGVLSDLGCAVRDAEEVSRVLKERFCFADHEVMLMTCQRKRDYLASQNNIEEQLHRLREMDDLEYLVVGFWGHGIRVPGGSESRYYLCASDTKLERLEKTGISFMSLEDTLQRAGAKNTCLILDSCQSVKGRHGISTQLPKEYYESSRGTPRDIKTGKRSENVAPVQRKFTTLYACSYDQLAYEWPESVLPKREHGIFTAHLLDAMYRSNRVSDWFEYIVPRVHKTASSKDLNQTPFICIEGGDIWFRTLEEEARKKQEEAKRKGTEEARKKQEEAKRKAAEEARKKQEEAERKAVEEARKKQEEAERKAAEEARKKQEEAERKAAEEARKKQEEADRKAFEGASRKREEMEKKIIEETKEQAGPAEEEQARDKVTETQTKAERSFAESKVAHAKKTLPAAGDVFESVADGVFGRAVPTPVITKGLIRDTVAKLLGCLGCLGMWIIIPVIWSMYLYFLNLLVRDYPIMVWTLTLTPWIIFIIIGLAVKRSKEPNVIGFLGCVFSLFAFHTLLVLILNFANATL